MSVYKCYFPNALPKPLYTWHIINLTIVLNKTGTFVFYENATRGNRYGKN